GPGRPRSQHRRNRRGYRQTWTRAGRRPDRCPGRVHLCPSSIVHQAGAAAPSAGRLLSSDIRRGRRLDVVWTRSLRLVPALSFLCRSHLEGGQAGRSSRSPANEVRTSHQSQDCEVAGPPNSTQVGRACRRGDRVKRCEFITLLGGAAAAWPLAVRAQKVGNLPTIGFQGATTPLAESQRIAAFVRRLRELDWIEGRTIA